jgi:hypothetical protein
MPESPQERNDGKYPADSAEIRLPRELELDRKNDDVGIELKTRQNDAREALKIKCALNRPERILQIKKHLIGYYDLENPAVLERLQYMEAINLPREYQESFNFFNDERLAGTMIVVLQDDLWIKGDQPSESSAENDLILSKQSYFEGQDDISWMTHELAHCLKRKDAPENYDTDSRSYAFPDLADKYPYPNNRVEVIAFTQQFQFLKEKGVSKEKIMKMIRKYYEGNDIPFFERLLDEIF